jgi:hypothetical protein
LAKVGLAEVIELLEFYQTFEQATALKKVRKTLNFKVLLQSKAIQRKIILLFFILYVLIEIYDKVVF